MTEDISPHFTHTFFTLQDGIAADPPEATITEIPRCLMRFETDVASTC